jgi:hypothetical protein
LFDHGFGPRAAEYDLASLKAEIARDPLRPPTNGQLKKAKSPMIDREISNAYERAAAGGEKPPNVNEIAQPVRASLAALGYSASGRQIKDLAKKEKHAAHRGRVGRRRNSK